MMRARAVPVPRSRRHPAGPSRLAAPRRRGEHVAARRAGDRGVPARGRRGRAHVRPAQGDGRDPGAPVRPALVHLRGRRVPRPRRRGAVAHRRPAARRAGLDLRADRGHRRARAAARPLRRPARVPRPVAPRPRGLAPLSWPGRRLRGQRDPRGARPRRPAPRRQRRDARRADEPPRGLRSARLPPDPGGRLEGARRRGAHARSRPAARGLHRGWRLARGPRRRAAGRDVLARRQRDRARPDDPRGDRRTRWHRPRRRGGLRPRCLRGGRDHARRAPMRRLPALVAAALAAALVAPATSADGQAPAPPRVERLGASVQGRPINVVRIGDPAAPRKVLVVGMIHGDEPEGRKVVGLLRAATPPPAVELLLVRDLNPDGLQRRTRQNAHGVDLNRNSSQGRRFLGGPGTRYYAGPKAFSEPETQAVRALILRVRPAVTVWYHQPFGLVDRPPTGGPAISRAYSRVSGLRFAPLAPRPGSMSRWENVRVRAGSSIVVELPGGPLPAAAARRHAAAVLALAAGQLLP